jgi:hypothetical protein
MELVHEVCGEHEWREILKRAVKQAKDGDAAARRRLAFESNGCLYHVDDFRLDRLRQGRPCIDNGSQIGGKVGRFAVECAGFCARLD